MTLAEWKEEIARRETEARASTPPGRLPVADLSDVPGFVIEAIRDATDRDRRDRILRSACELRKQANKRRGLARMLRNKGNDAAADRQESAADKLNAEADSLEAKVAA